MSCCVEVKGDDSSIDAVLLIGEGVAMEKLRNGDGGVKCVEPTVEAWACALDMWEWEKLCCYFSLTQNLVPHEYYVELFRQEEEEEDDNTEPEGNNDEEIFEVSKVLNICYDDPKNNCKERIKNFVVKGFKLNILPLPVVWFNELSKSSDSSSDSSIERSDSMHILQESHLKTLEDQPCFPSM
ncbi:hypothetical protein MTR_8g442780 [Medicago truncatula]|uniref:Uncharacterized protein n=1 Tax=Medicago truncatula TaxID=3880 RepID=A0A072U059_MEDTR|nr:hypothetical protein MTR_8g442780 [Medicago truncatula]